MLLPDLFGRDVLVASNPMADNVTFHQVRRDGSLREIGAQWTYGSDLPNLELAEVITVGATTFAYASTVDGAGISGFKIRPNYKVIPLTHDAVDADLAAGSITGLAAAHVGASSYLFSVDYQTSVVTTYMVRLNGRLDEVTSYEPGDGSGFSGASALESLTIGGEEYLLLAAAGSSTLTMFSIGQDGYLSEVSQVRDDQGTRFQNVDVIELLDYRGRTFLLAAGSDLGLSLFEINPDGSLFHLKSIVDDQYTTLNKVTSISATAAGRIVQVVVASEGDEGVSIFDLDLGRIGSIAIGTAQSENILGNYRDNLLFGGAGNDSFLGGNGDDRFYDGDGQDVMKGGPGDDVFVMANDQDIDLIRDFTFGEDRIDLSALNMLYHYAALTFLPMSNGVRIDFYDERLIVRTPDYDRLTFEDFSQDDFIFG
jgi:Ca2+-binding RTX toxin-like protein